MQTLSRPASQAFRAQTELEPGIALSPGTRRHLRRAVEERSTSTPIRAAGTIPNGDSAE